MGISWCGQIEQCEFLMHLTIANWDSHRWMREANYTYEDGIQDLQEIQRHFTEWQLQWSPTFLRTNRIEATDVIGTIKKDGTWRTVLNFDDKQMKEELYTAKGRFEAEFAVGPFTPRRRLHFSLDKWWGTYPVWMEAEIQTPFHERHPEKARTYRVANRNRVWGVDLSKVPRAS